jgi:DNA-binding NarL/FixJ family response regulator
MTEITSSGVLAAAETGAARRIRVVLVEQDPISRHVLTSVLNQGRHTDVLAAVGQRERIEEVAAGADVVVLAIAPDEPVPACVNALSAQRGRRVLLLSSHWTKARMDAAFAAGASGCLVKEPAMTSLNGALQAVCEGLVVTSPQVHARRSHHTHHHGRGPEEAGAPEQLSADRLITRLTEREREVVARIAEGYTTDEVARKLRISPATVKSHISHCLTKLGVRNRVQAVLLVRSLLEQQGGTLPEEPRSGRAERQDRPTTGPGRNGTGTSAPGAPLRRVPRQGGIGSLTEIAHCC